MNTTWNDRAVATWFDDRDGTLRSSDRWLFASSGGPLTAGRRDADRALLPDEATDPELAART
jgi:hypothetical protein